MLRDSYKNRLVLGVLILAICAFAGAAFYAFNSSLSQPDNLYLTASPKARWIKLDLPFRLNARNNSSEMTLFRRKFDLKDRMDIRLYLKAFRGAGIWLDDMPVRKFDGNMQKWREGIILELPDLAAGKHELKIAVVNENAHPALLLWAEVPAPEALDLSTPEKWEASRDDFVWNPAVDVAKPGRLHIVNGFERSDQALLASLPLMLPLFLLGAGFVWMRESGKGPAFIRSFDCSPAQFRFILLGLWAVMAFNNFHALPLKLGMDSVGHFKYIEYVADNFSLPSPLEGWQMFQPPLYYIISAVFYKFLLLIMDVESALYWLRLVPLACGAIMIEVCYRCAVKAFDENRFAQIGATLISGFLPMNFAMAQFWGNEPLAAVFSSLTILMCLIIINDRDRRNLKDFGQLGVCLGLAILSKATCALLIPLVFFFVLLPLMAEKSDSSVKKVSCIRGVILSLITTTVLGGWYYLRNLLSYGKPFVGGWDKSREISWWQDHSYRLWRAFLQFWKCCHQACLLYSKWNLGRPLFDSLVGC